MSGICTFERTLVKNVIKMLLFLFFLIKNDTSATVLIIDDDTSSVKSNFCCSEQLLSPVAHARHLFIQPHSPLLLSYLG